MAAAAVGGVLLDESLLVDGDEAGNPRLSFRVAVLLRRLKYSKLRWGISHQEDVSSQKADFLSRTAESYSAECICVSTSNMADSLNDSLHTWSGSGKTCVYVTSRNNDELISEFQKQGWSIVVPDNEGISGVNANVLFIDNLEKLLFVLCDSNKKATHNSSVVVVGYVMKPSREEDFAKRGAFPLDPTQSGLMFVPLTLEAPLEPQVQAVDVVLHKATDEMMNIDPSSSFDFPKGICYSNGMRELERYFQNHPECCVIDPLSRTYPLLDRLKIQEILLGLEDVHVKDQNKIRAPHFMKVGCFQEPHLQEQLREAKLCFPVIIKPQVACGVADAHNMALVFKFEDIRDLHVPLPAIVQEYVDHGSLLFKFYVLGEKVFHAIKKSMPNANVLKSSSEEAGFTPISFNSLKSLPISKEDQPSMGAAKIDEQSLDVELVNKAANWLRRKLGLTIFGFDVVIQEGTNDHVIVDLNYLPSFKEIPDNDAIPAFWDAIKNGYELWRSKQMASSSDQTRG